MNLLFLPGGKNATKCNAIKEMKVLIFCLCAVLICPRQTLPRRGKKHSYTCGKIYLTIKWLIVAMIAVNDLMTWNTLCLGSQVQRKEKQHLIKTWFGVLNSSVWSTILTVSGEEVRRTQFERFILECRASPNTNQLWSVRDHQLRSV